MAAGQLQFLLVRRAGDLMTHARPAVATRGGGALNHCNGQLTVLHACRVQETHSNLVHLGQEWQQQQQQQQAHDARAAGSSSSLAAASFGTAAAPAPDAVKASSALPFDLAALLSPTAAAAAGKGVSRRAPPPAADPMQQALTAAGGHPGLVPALSCFVGMMRTPHQLLALRGARGIARVCYAAGLGAPSAPRLLKETKATAAAVGGISSLVELLRCAWRQRPALQNARLLVAPLLLRWHSVWLNRMHACACVLRRSTATKYLLLEQGAALPADPALKHLADQVTLWLRRGKGSLCAVLLALERR
jgi:hypothetical protein